MNKYLVLFVSAIIILLTFKAYAFTFYNDNEQPRKHYNDGGQYGRSQQKWVCNRYNPNCYRAYRTQRGYYSYGYPRQKQRKKSVVKNTEPKHVYVAPPEKIESTNIINVNLAHGTWAAYDSEGKLVNSGHVSGGKSFCSDINKACKTTTGTFKIYEKRGSGCKSKIFPVGKGGAPMPYCMFFKEGYALHGSNAVPNYNASHGCVRMSASDAQWLNENFVNVGTTRVNVTYEKMEPLVEKKVAIEKQDNKESIEMKTSKASSNTNSEKTSSIP